MRGQERRWCKPQATPEGSAEKGLQGMGAEPGPQSWEGGGGGGQRRAVLGVGVHLCGRGGAALVAGRRLGLPLVLLRPHV